MGRSHGPTRLVLVKFFSKICPSSHVTVMFVAEVWSEDDLNGSALSFFFPGTPPQAQAIELYERGISTYRPLFVSHEGVSNRPPIRTIQEMERVKHIRKLHKLITIDTKSVKYLSVSESSWQLSFAYIPSEIPCEVVLSFSAILGDNSR